MLSRIALALALALAGVYAAPATAGPRTCGFNVMIYDSSGSPTGPYCH
jgi:hypothetical protein